MARLSSINVQDCARQVTIKVDLRGMRVFRARLWLGKQIIRFAFFVIGTRSEFED